MKKSCTKFFYLKNIFRLNIYANIYFLIIKIKIDYFTKTNCYPNVDPYVWPYYKDIIALVWRDPTSVLIGSPKKLLLLIKTR